MCKVTSKPTLRSAGGPDCVHDVLVSQSVHEGGGDPLEQRVAHAQAAADGLGQSVREIRSALQGERGRERKEERREKVRGKG